VLQAISLALATRALPAAAQKIPLLGYLGARSRNDPYYEAFVAGLRELGYVEGKTIHIEWRLAENDVERLRGLALELVKLNPDVLATHATLPTQTLARATSTIPIVFMSMIDPVGAGVVQSLARSGNNVTGLSNISVDVTPKQIELLKAMMPALSRVGVLVNPGNPAHAGVVRSIETSAQKVGIKVVPFWARDVGEIDQVFAAMARDKLPAAIVVADTLYISQGKQLAALGLKHRIAVMSPIRDDALAGTLASYGPATAQIYRRGANYVDKILKGARPSDLPVEQPTEVELVLNLKTAKALGIAVPKEVRILAATVIE
jgi:putative tryptophan/tyrosine transport system substrate-binding protein